MEREGKRKSPKLHLGVRFLTTILIGLVATPVGSDYITTHVPNTNEHGTFIWNYPQELFSEV